MKKPTVALGTRYGFFRAAAGWCAAAWTARGLSALVLPQKSKATATRKLSEALPPLPPGFWDRPPAPVPRNIPYETQKALDKKPFAAFPLDISFLTPFQQGILRATCRIPWGQTRTYGWVARKAGSPRGFRAAGQALNRNPIPLFIPCHRVIAGENRLGGYGGGLEWKIRLLKREGIGVKGGRVFLWKICAL